MIRRLAAFALALMLASPAAAQPGAAEARFAADMTALSTDAMEGRFPGTAGETRALAYLQAAFEKAGVQPGVRKRWLQPVALEYRKATSNTATGRSPKGLQDFTGDIRLVGDANKTWLLGAPLVYGGYATAVDPSVRGSVVLYRDQDLPGAAFPQQNDETDRAALLRAAGAKGALVILSDAAFNQRQSRDLPTLSARVRRPFAISGYIRESALRRLLADNGEDLAALDVAATSARFRPVSLKARIDLSASTQIRRVTSHNLIGRIPGSKPGSGALLYTAHWDAFGVCKPGQADTVCNGAIDNASGLAGLLEVARMFKAGPPPERDILFVATTAEEYGLLGARAYAGNPVAPLSRTVAAINIDTITLYGRGHAAGFIGAGLTDADPQLVSLAATQNRVLDAGPVTRQLFKSSDAWALLKAGVPAYVFSGVISQMGADNGSAFVDFIARRVHTPTDEMRPDIRLDGAIEDVELSYRAGLAFSAADARINFLPSSPFQRPVY